MASVTCQITGTKLLIGLVLVWFLRLVFCGRVVERRLEAVERRLEALVYSREDAQRHVGQVVMQFDLEEHGGPEVAGRWVQGIVEQWRTARARLGEDGSQGAWQALVTECLQDMRFKAQKQEGASSSALQVLVARSLEEGLTEHLRKAISKQTALQVDARRWLENLEVHLKDVALLKVFTPEELEAYMQAREVRFQWENVQEAQVEAEG